MNLVRYVIRITCVITGVMGLIACTGLPTTDALKVYQLPETRLAQEAQQPYLTLSLRINTPYTGFALSSPRIIVNAEGEQLSSYKGVRWSDPPPALLREHFATAFARYGGLASISTDEHALHADMHLGGDLRRFYLENRSTPRVVIELNARIVNPTSRRIEANRTFKIEQPLQDMQILHVVEAFGIAADKLAEQLIQWTFVQLQKGIDP